MSTADTELFEGASLNQKPTKPWYTLKCQFPADARHSKEVTNLSGALCLKVVIAGTYAYGEPDTVLKTRDKHFLFHLRVRGVTHHFFTSLHLTKRDWPHLRAVFTPGEH